MSTENSTDNCAGARQKVAEAHRELEEGCAYTEEQLNDLALLECHNPGSRDYDQAMERLVKNM
jgi:hypothetical protein